MRRFGRLTLLNDQISCTGTTKGSSPVFGHPESTFLHGGKLLILLLIQHFPQIPDGVKFFQVNSRFFRQKAGPLAFARAGRFFHPFGSTIVSGS